MDRASALVQVEVALKGIRPRRARDVMAVWGRSCPLLAGAGLSAPGEVPGWVWGLGPQDADRVLRALVGLAQDGDEVAVLTALTCLRPGVCALAGATGVPVDELVSELTAVVLEFPLARRRSVAGQLLLDARKRLVKGEATREAPEGDTRLRLEDLEAPGELGAGTRAAEQLSELVREAWRGGHLSGDAARLVLLTRVWGEPIAVAAARLGVNPSTARKGRSRAEARIARALR